MAKSLTERLLAASTSKYASTVSNSVIFKEDDTDQIGFDHPILNVIYSGSMRGGFHAGNTTWAGPSKHFKSLFSLLQAKAYIKNKPNAKIVLIDSEFGMPVTYFESVGINPDDVIHIPITNIEEMKTETVNLLNELERGEEVIFVIDSIGNLASIKEVEDAAMPGASPADMTRAKQLKSYFRIVTPMFKLRNIGLVVVNHTYQTLEMFSKTVLGGGCVAENTPILLADGTVKPIQDIQAGDRVCTLEGNFEVTDTWNPLTLQEGVPECVELELEDGTLLVVSQNHQVWTKGGWKCVQDLNEGDEVLNISEV